MAVRGGVEFGGWGAWGVKVCSWFFASLFRRPVAFGTRRGIRWGFRWSRLPDRERENRAMKERKKEKRGKERENVTCCF